MKIKNDVRNEMKEKRIIFLRTWYIRIIKIPLTPTNTPPTRLITSIKSLKPMTKRESGTRERS